MSQYRTFSPQELDAMLAEGEIPASVRQAADKVAVILTQDWCPQWHDMDRFLPEFADEVTVYVLVYNKHPRFQTVMGFKENPFGNFEVPYLRYYVKGELITTSNFLPRNTFAALLKKTKPFQIG